MCCSMMKAPGLLAVAPTAALLAISFFVLIVNKKQEGGLRAFGYVVAAVLWLAALCVLSCGVYMSAKDGFKHKTGKMMMMKEGMMGEKGCMMQSEMMKPPMPMK